MKTKTKTQTPSEERLAHDVSKLRKLGADAIIKDGGIVICGDLVCHKEKIKNAEIFQYITHVFGKVFFTHIKSLPDNFMPSLVRVGVFVRFYELTSVGDNFMPSLVGVGESVWFDRLTSVGDNFMPNLVGMGWNFLFDKLTSVGDSFLQNLVGIGFNVSFGELTSVGNNFMSSLVGIGGNASFLNMPTEWRKKTCLKFKKLEKKYYQEHGFAYFDGIFSIVDSTRSVGDYTIYSCMFGKYIAQKGDYTAHAKSVKGAVKDLEHKIYVNNIKTEKLSLDDEIDAMKYRAITGACFMGMQDFLEENKIEFSIKKDNKGNITELITKSIKVPELLQIIGDNYGADKIKGLIKLK